MPKEHTTADAPHKTAVPPTKGTATTPAGSHAARPTATASSSDAAVVPINPTAPATATPTSLPPSSTGGSSGLSTPAIGGIAAGAAVLVALVGLVFYKRRKRAVAASKDFGGGGNGERKDEPMYLSASNYGKKNKRGHSTAISGPLALASENDESISPVRSLFPPPIVQQQQQRQQQQQLIQQQQQQLQQQDVRGGGGSAADRDLHLHEEQLGAAFGGPTRHQGRDEDYTNNHNNGSRGNNINGLGINTSKGLGYSHNNGSHDSRSPLHNDYYEEYFGGKEPVDEPPPPLSPSQFIGAQRSPVSHGRLTPAPGYYLGKEDIDPRRDLRGLDSPETYMHDKKTPSSPPAPVHVQQQSGQGQGQEQGQGQGPRQQGPPATSPRSSYSSDDDDAASGYLTLEQAQKAHQQKMMGHKESIGSVQVLVENSSARQQHQQQQQQPQPKQQQSPPPQRQQQQHPGELRSPTTPSFAPEHASMTISDSTMSMMPSLPSNSSPMPFSPHQNTNGNNRGDNSNGRMGPPPVIKAPSAAKVNRGPDSSLLSPLSHSFEDPYAESAYSEDFGEGPSFVSNTPLNGPYGGGSSPHMRPGQPPASPGGKSYSPYPPSPHGPGPYALQGGGGGYRPPGPGPHSPGYGMSSPPYSGGGYGGGRPSPQQQQQQMRGPGGNGGGYGPGRPGPGQGYGSPVMGRGPPLTYPPQNNNGYPPRVGSPGPGPNGYRPHPQQQRDPAYGNQGYQRAY